MSTIRCEFHCLREGAVTAPRREVGSTIFRVIEGRGSVVIGDDEHKLDIGDIFVIASWVQWSLQTETQFDLFRFSDAPIMERLNFARTLIEGMIGERRPGRSSCSPARAARCRRAL